MRVPPFLRGSVLLSIAGAAVVASSLTFTHLAGSFGGPGFDDATGSEARFNEGSALAVDGAGNVYVADTANHTIRRITTAGVVTTFAGLAESEELTNGRGGNARFRRPEGLALDGAGNLYVADTGNHAIRMITAARVVTTIAGSGESGFANGTTAARFNSPRGVAVDSSGNIYVADTGNHAIRKIAGGVVSTLAGTGAAGSANGTGSGATFDLPTAVVWDASTNTLFVADSGNNVIRQVTLPGAVVTTFAGTMNTPGHLNGIPGRFGTPYGLALGAGGMLYVSDSGDHSIRSVTSGGFVGEVAGAPTYPGPEDGTGGAARFREPRGLAFAGTSLYVADSGNHTVRRMNVSSTAVETMAGLANAAGFVNATGSAARFNEPSAVFYYPAPSPYGFAYVADTQNNAIRRVSDAGVVTTLAGGSWGYLEGVGTAAQFKGPRGLAGHAWDLSVYVADTGNHCIRRVAGNGTTTLIAGQPGVPGDDDGDRLTTATFDSPREIVFTSFPSDTLYVHDSGTHTIRKIDLVSGAVTTLMFAWGYFDQTNGGMGLTTVGDDLYVAGGGLLAKRTSAGVVTTVAGGCCDGPVDGTGTDAKFAYPGPRSMSALGSSAYVLDALANQVRLFDVNTTEVTTVAGRPTPAASPYSMGSFVRPNRGTAPGTGAFARFNVPTSIYHAGSLVPILEGHTLRIGRTVSLADRATIDAASGTIGAARQLDAQPQNANSWQWSIIRRPTGSNAVLSSSTVRNPTFTPDIADVYVFRCVATNTSSGAMSISTIALAASDDGVTPSVPTGMTATAVGTSSVSLTWTASPQAVSYQVRRRSSSGTTTIASPTATSHTDSTVVAGQAYIYSVRAVGNAGLLSNWSSPDVATLIVFTNDPLSAGTSVVRAVHVTQLRQAVNAVRLAAGLSAFSFTDPSLAAGFTIDAVHLQQLRTALDGGRSSGGLPAIMYSGSAAAGTEVEAVHVTQLRNGVK